MTVKSLPAGYHNVTPILTVKGADRVIEFLKQTFGAQEKERHQAPNGTIMHAELKIGDSLVMLGEANEQWQPKPAALYVYVDNADATYRRALDAGATSLSEPADQFYGDRNGRVTDPSGNVWVIATHVEDVSQQELEKRMKAFAQKVA